MISCKSTEGSRREFLHHLSIDIPYLQIVTAGFGVHGPDATLADE